MSATFGADPSLIVSGISAVLQAVQTWIAFRDSDRAARAFNDTIAQGVSNPALAQAARQLTLAPAPVVQALSNRVQHCWNRYLDMLNAPPGTYFPPDIDDATKAVKLCVCSELSRLKAVNGSLPAGQFSDWWQEYGCN